ncbi:hypothetical protein ACFQUU_27090 [Herbaspirillum sp. GCM10030257]|uniref:hypothetical protein n=1 Tax=Herbaspirillum sp. GCM10030257 TaxID=3273393 RepID=UPI00361D513C
MNLKAAIALVVFTVLVGTHWKVYVMGKEKVRAEWNADKVAADKQAENNRLLRQAAINKPAAQFAEKVAKDRVITQTIIKEVEKYVPNSIGMLPGGFRVYHDAAAAGEAPDDSSRADAAAVAPQVVAVTIAENYADSNYDKQRLEALQAIVRASGCFVVALD